MTASRLFLRRLFCRHDFQWSRRFGNTITCRKCGHRKTV